MVGFSELGADGEGNEITVGLWVEVATEEVGVAERGVVVLQIVEAYTQGHGLAPFDELRRW